jgi:hypothetical protein
VVPVSISAYENAGGLAITQDGSLYEWDGLTNAVQAQVTFPPAVTEVNAVSRRFSHTTPTKVPGEDNAINAAASEYTSIAIH